MSNFKQLVLTAAGLLCMLAGFAQPGCPAVTVGNNVTLQCGGPSCTTLSATAFEVGSTSTYTVSQIPYSPPASFSTGTLIPPPNSNGDDYWSPAITLPFNFCFFDTAYNQVIVESNGVVSFNVADSNQIYASYTISGPAPYAGESNDLQNSIMGAYQDLDNTNQGQILYEVGGTAPCRWFKASWYNCDMYGDSNSVLTGYCNEDDYQTQMIILYETTNVIEIYIQNKQQPCDDGGQGYWNGGDAIEGIQNNSLTTFIGVPGRNATQWSATNDAWRFTPAGPSIVSLGWYNGAQQISNTGTVQVCPSTTTTYTAQATYAPCGTNQPVVVTGTVTVTPAGTVVSGIDSVKNVSCNGGHNGAAFAYATTTQPPLIYGWSNGATTLSITNLSAGTYVFTANDAGNCLHTDTVVITEPAPININLPGGSSLKCGAAGFVTVIPQVTGGTAPYSYQWSNNTTGDSLSVDSSGNYVVIVSDSNLCTAIGSTNIIVQVDSFSLTAPTIKNVSCFEGSNGSIIVNTANGAAPISYQWSNFATGDTLMNVPNGQYTIYVTDANNCTSSATYTINQPGQLVITNPVLINIGCSLTAKGSITAQVSGGTPAYAYSWTDVSNPQTFTGVSISNLDSGTYILTVTDANGCADSASYQITQYMPVTLSVDSTNVTCYGGDNGTASVTVLTGTAPYYYSWDYEPDSTTNTSIAGLSQGPVNIFVVDANNCSAQRFIYITQPTPDTVAATITNVSCYGDSDGAITVAGGGGTPGYTYAWNNSVSGATNAAIPAGTYTVTVTDANSCTGSGSFAVSQPAPLLINPPAIQDIGCAGGNTGSITANASQGTPGYTYTWLSSPGGQSYTGQTISNLAPGNYALTVTDANSCVDTSSYIVTAIPVLAFTVSSTPVSCYAGNNGSVVVSVTSGTAPFKYSFDNGNFGSDSTLSTVSSGNLLVTVKDTNNCQADTTIFIPQPPQIVISLTSPQVNVLCNGGNNGQLHVTATGGTPGYSFTWSNQVAGTNNINLTAGPYTLIVVDTNDCADTANYIITQPTPLVANPVAVNALCYAGQGSIDANPSGGTPGYTFIWNNGETTRVADTLVQGLYSCTVTDANGCTTITTDTVGQAAQIVLVIDSGIAPLCVGQHNGKLIVKAAGGVPSYSYSATNDGANFYYAADSLIGGLDTGTYNILVFDSVGCSVEIPGYVPAAVPDSFYQPVIDSTLCYGPDYNDGSVNVIAATPQNGPYQYAIDGGALQDSGYFANLSAGPHTVEAVSHNGCTTQIPIVVPQPLPIVAIVTPDSLTLPLGGSQQVQVSYLNATNPGYNWTASMGLSCIDCPNPVVNAYTSGTYVVTVSMVNGTATCYGSTTLYVNVLSHTRAYVPNAFTPNGDGNDDVFQIYGEDIKTINMKVFNRWGELVYATTNSLAGWDGTYKGVMQLPGVYTYEVEITYLDDSQEKRIGSITLIR